MEAVDRSHYLCLDRRRDYASEAKQRHRSLQSLWRYAKRSAAGLLGWSDEAGCGRRPAANGKQIRLPNAQAFGRPIGTGSYMAVDGKPV